VGARTSLAMKFSAIVENEYKQIIVMSMLMMLPMRRCEMEKYVFQ
jgi:hypothetical protein